MKRILPRSLYSSVVGFVIVTMSVNPASGGWLLHKIRCGSHAQQGAAHCEITVPCEPVCCEAPIYVEPCCGVSMGSAPAMMHGQMPVVGSGCCGNAAIHGNEVWQGDGAMHGGDPMHEGSTGGDHEVMQAPSTETWSAPATGSNAPAPAPVDDSNESSSSDVAEPTAPADSATKEMPSSAPPAPEQPAVAAPADTTPAPADTTPAPAATAPDSLFDEPAAQPAAPAAADDIFGEAPAATPSPAMPAAPAEQPAADNLFGEPAAKAPGDAVPMDDLFGEPAAPAAAPAESAPAATAPADDIFGTPPAAEPAAPAAEPAAPAADPAAPAAPAKDSLDDLFGSSAPTDQSATLANSHMRVWIDNSGEFSTQGRLIEVGADFIRLVKANGRTCTVPQSRLCTADVAYVASIAVVSDDVKVAMAPAR